jgi:undecaprenyl pyrophosphate phosphatase UppP
VHAEGYRLDVLVIGVMAAAIAGVLASHCLVNFPSAHQFDALVYYRFALAAIILVWLRG